MKPISKTAFVCCGIRMHDAESSQPLCGDTYARRFREGEGQRILSSFAGMADGGRSAAANVVRHRIIDDLLRREQAATPDLLVVVLGAGFESRAYRLPGGTWVELDEPQVIAFKDERLPVSECPNALHRIPIDFSSESIEEKLAPFAGRTPVVIVVEGVIVYLEIPQIRDLLKKLRALFPKHTLVCELFTRKFCETYGKKTHEKIQDLGATFKYAVDRPEELFIQGGYRLADRISIAERTVDLGGMKVPFGIPRFLVRRLLSTAVMGYTVCVFALG